jgi:hypothetical protein
MTLAPNAMQELCEFFVVVEASSDKPLAICTAAKPTPPAAAVTKTHSPIQ